MGFYRGLISEKAERLPALSKDLADSTLVGRMNQFLTENLKHDPLSREEISLILSNPNCDVAPTYSIDAVQICDRLDEVVTLGGNFSAGAINLLACLRQSKMYLHEGRIPFSTDYFVRACLVANSLATGGESEIRVHGWIFSSTLIPDLLISGLKPAKFVGVQE